MKAHVTRKPEQGVRITLEPESPSEAIHLGRFHKFLSPGLPKLQSFGVQLHEGTADKMELFLVPGQGPTATHEGNLRQRRVPGETCAECGGSVQRTGRCQTCLSCGNSSCH